VYFITQSPTDIPDDILGQLGNRVQHALRAYTPKDQKAVRAAAQTFRANPAFDTETAIMELGTGEALISVLDEKGAPTIVQRARVLFPLSQIGAISEGQRLDIQNAAPDEIKEYASFFDRESAYEVLMAQKAQEDIKAAEQQRLEEEERMREEAEKAEAAREKEAARRRKEEEKVAKQKEKSSVGGWTRTIFGTLIGAVIGSVAREVGNQVGKAVSGGTSSKRTSSKRKTSSTRTALGKVAKSATTTATRKVTTEILKSIFK
jgi:hypothetical protein